MNIDFQYQSIGNDKEKKLWLRLISISDRHRCWFFIDYHRLLSIIIGKDLSCYYINGRCCPYGIIESFSRDIMHFFYDDKILKEQNTNMNKLLFILIF